MSGDVQPRKRKDKRRKKEDDDSGSPPPTLVNPSSENSTDSVTIHVHKEGGTGGHWCARIVFFVLLSILVGLVALIILEHRGSTDVDTPIAASRWAILLDGWLEDAPPGHEDSSAENEARREEPEEESRPIDEVSEGSEEESDDTERDEAEAEESEAEEEEEEEEEEIDESDEGFEEENSTNEDNRDFGTLEELDNASEEDTEDAEQSWRQRDDAVEDEEAVEDEDEEEEEGARSWPEPELEVSSEGARASSESEDEDISGEFYSIPGVGEMEDDSAEPLEEIEDGDIEDEAIEDGDESETGPEQRRRRVLPEEQEEEEEEEEEEESASVAVKFGVGVALIVAAHFVLVGRWNNAAEDPSDLIHLSRRNTIVTAPSPEAKIIQSREAPGRHRRDHRPETEDSSGSAPNLSLRRDAGSPDREISSNGGGPRATDDGRQNEDETRTSESERQSATDPEEEEEEEEDDEDEEEELDDGELVAKLEAKYGKLPTPTESEDEDEEEEEEEDDEEEEEQEEEEEEEEEDEEDEAIRGWKRVGAPPGGSRTAPPADAERARRQSGGKEAPSVKSSDGRSSGSGGKDTRENVNESVVDEIAIDEEEIDTEHDGWLSKEFDN